MNSLYLNFSNRKLFRPYKACPSPEGFRTEELFERAYPHASFRRATILSGTGFEQVSGSKTTLPDTLLLSPLVPSCVFWNFLDTSS